MSGLSYLCEYGDSDESEAERDYTSETKSKLPTPDLSKVPVIYSDSHWDDPQQHNGRIRTFPHVRGNWSTLVYIKYPNESNFEDLVNKIKFVVSTKEDPCYQCENLHISVSKTVVLKYHLISSFTASLQKAISEVECFDLGFDTVEVYTNEEKTRTFIALKSNPLSRKFLLNITEQVDTVLKDYNLPTFYEDSSFHMSILWWNGDRKENILKHIDKFNNILAQEKEAYQNLDIRKVYCKVGNKFYQFYLD